MKKISSAVGTPKPQTQKDMVAKEKPTAGIKRLTLDIPTELHRAIKLNAVEEGVTMVEKLRALLVEHYEVDG